MLCRWVHSGVSYRGNEPVNDPWVPEASTSFGESAQILIDLHGHLGGVSTAFRDMGLGDGHLSQPQLSAGHNGHLEYEYESLWMPQSQKWVHFLDRIDQKLVC